MQNQHYSSYPSVVLSPMRRVNSVMPETPEFKPHILPMTPRTFYPGPGYRTPPATSFEFDPRFARSPPTPIYIRPPSFPDSNLTPPAFKYASPYTPHYALTFTPPRGAGSMPRAFESSPLIDPFQRMCLERETYRDFEKPKFNQYSSEGKTETEEKSSFSETHLVIAALDRKQSLQLQKHIAKAKANRNTEELESLFYQFLPEVLRLSRDQYANFVLQRLIENLDQPLVDLIADRVKKNCLVFSTNQYACRVLQSVINRCSQEKRMQLLDHLLPELDELLQNNFGCYVLQKMIETVKTNEFQLRLSGLLLPKYFELSVHSFSCRVMQDVFRYFHQENKGELTGKIMESVVEMSQDGYGNYVVQKMVHYGDTDTRKKVSDALLPHVASLATNKAGSNILEKILSKATDEQKLQIARPIMDENHLGKIVQDQFGNYVIQRLLVSLPYADRQLLVHALKTHFEKRTLAKLNTYENYVYQQILK